MMDLFTFLFIFLKDMTNTCSSCLINRDGLFPESVCVDFMCSWVWRELCPCVTHHLKCLLGNVVWLDDDTCIRALINASRMPDPEAVTTETDSANQPGEQRKGQCAGMSRLSTYGEGGL